MFDFKVQAELKNINVRAQAEGDEYVPAIDIKLMLLDVPLDRVKAIYEDFDVFYEGDRVRVEEFLPLVAGHKLENLRVDYDGNTMIGCDVKKGAKVFLKPGKVANIELTVQADEFTEGAFMHLVNNQKETITVSFSARQLKVAEMEQATG